MAKYNDWTAENIYTRSKELLEFMENRWEFSFNNEQLDKLVYVNFAVDGRTVPEELPVPEEKPIQSKEDTDTHEYSSLDELQKAFWVNFVKYCNDRDREDIVGRKPLVQNWYDIPGGANDFLLQFTITRSKYVSLVIYAFGGETFKRLESKKSVIEKIFEVMWEKQDFFVLCRSRKYYRNLIVQIGIYLPCLLETIENTYYGKYNCCSGV